MRSGKRQGTLAGFWMRQKTAMGSRLLKRWIDRPLINQNAISERQDKSPRVTRTTSLERSNFAARV